MRKKSLFAPKHEIPALQSRWQRDPPPRCLRVCGPVFKSCRQTGRMRRRQPNMQVLESLPLRCREKGVGRTPLETFDVRTRAHRHPLYIHALPCGFPGERKRLPKVRPFTLRQLSVLKEMLQLRDDLPRDVFGRNRQRHSEKYQKRNHPSHLEIPHAKPVLFHSCTQSDHRIFSPPPSYSTSIRPCPSASPTSWRQTKPRSRITASTSSLATSMGEGIFPTCRQPRARGSSNETSQKDGQSPRRVCQASTSRADGASVPPCTSEAFGSDRSATPPATTAKNAVSGTRTGCRFRTIRVFTPQTFPRTFFWEAPAVETTTAPSRRFPRPGESTCHRGRYQDTPS